MRKFKTAGERTCANKAFSGDEAITVAVGESEHMIRLCGAAGAECWSHQYSIHKHGQNEDKDGIQDLLLQVDELSWLLCNYAPVYYHICTEGKSPGQAFLIADGRRKEPRGWMELRQMRSACYHKLAESPS